MCCFSSPPSKTSFQFQLSLPNLGRHISRTFTMKLTAVLALISSLALLAQCCSTDDDCSLNGICDLDSSTCTCDPGWTTADCGHLDLSPATRYTGYNNTNVTLPGYYGSKGNSSWAGQIIQDRHDKGLFHLILEHFAHGCGLGGWYVRISYRIFLS